MMEPPNGTAPRNGSAGVSGRETTLGREFAGTVLVSGKPWQPLIDVRDNPIEFVLFADIPGVDEDDIHVEVQERKIVIRGEREFDHDSEDAEEFVRLERLYGPFERVVDLPRDLDLNRVTAKYRRGVLKIRVPRAGSPQPVVVRIDR